MDFISSKHQVTLHNRLITEISFSSDEMLDQQIILLEEYSILFLMTSSPFVSIESIEKGVDNYLAEPVSGIVVQLLDWWKNHTA